MISAASIISTLRRHGLPLLIGGVLLFVASAAALAVDGNYVSPYASQYATRNTAAAIPNETWLGMLLVTVTAAVASYYALRNRIRQRRPA